MKVGDIMSRDVTTIKLDMPLIDAARIMKEKDIGAIPVTDDQKIKGMLTDRDIVVRAIAEGRDPAKTAAKDVMTEHIRYLFEDDDVSRAAEMMKDRQIRRLVVLTRDKRLCGFVSLGDLARQARDERLSADVTRRVSEPGGSQPSVH